MQDVILMSDSCDVCGYKSSEIKGGGAISDKGRLITVQVTEQEDLRRDVIKADSAVVSPFCSCPFLAAEPERTLQDLKLQPAAWKAAAEIIRYPCAAHQIPNAAPRSG